jgi:hypothetical protein
MNSYGIFLKYLTDFGLELPGGEGDIVEKKRVFHLEFLS